MFDRIKQYAKDHQIPIIQDEGLLFLKDIIKQYHIKDVLEIGTAIGYSALQMTSCGCYVDTIERDLVMIELAKNNIKNYDDEHQINLIEANALSFDGHLRSYDMIFIDAAKAQYKKFFEKYVPYLKPNGIVICDNLNFHHLDQKKVNRNTRQLLRKLSEFKTFLIEHQDFETTFFEVGDGMSLTKRKNL